MQKISPQLMNNHINRDRQLSESMTMTKGGEKHANVLIKTMQTKSKS